MPRALTVEPAAPVEAPEQHEAVGVDHRNVAEAARGGPVGSGPGLLLRARRPAQVLAEIVRAATVIRAQTTRSYIGDESNTSESNDKSPSPFLDAGPSLRLYVEHPQVIEPRRAVIAPVHIHSAGVPDDYAIVLSTARADVRKDGNALPLAKSGGGVVVDAN